MKISDVTVEVESTETFENDKRMEFQTLFIHGTGSKYPQRVSNRLEGGAKPLAPGFYRPAEYLVDYGKLVVDYDKMIRVKESG